MDPPDHVGFRKLVNREFTPRAIGEPRAAYPRAPHGRGARAHAGSASFDFVDLVAAPFPVLVIAELLGIPDGDRADFRRWSDATIESPDRPPDEDRRGDRRAVPVPDRARRRRSAANPATTSSRCSSDAEVDGRAAPTADELSIFLLTLLVAGNETTRTLISGGTLALARAPRRSGPRWPAIRRSSRARSRSACAGSRRFRRSAAP